MMTVYTLEQSEKWDSIVKKFKEYDIYWLSGYVKAFKIHGDGEPLLFFYSGDNTIGMNVVMRRDVACDYRFEGKIEKNNFYDLTSPYGYGGWIIEGEDIDSLFCEYIEWISKNNIICEFVRFHPIIKNHEKVRSFYDITQLGKVVHMELDSPEHIWNNITSKNRNMIRKAIKNDIKIYNGRFPDIYSKFRNIYNATMDRDDADKYYYFEEDFYRSLLEDLPENAQIFWAEKDSEILAASIITMANGRMNYHLSGSIKEYSCFAPTNYILYKAALWGSENGCKTLYLGGGVGSGEDSLFKFKTAFFKGDLHYFYIGSRVYNESIYRKLVEMRGNLGSSFFPLYRAKG